MMSYTKKVKNISKTFLRYYSVSKIQTNYNSDVIYNTKITYNTKTTSKSNFTNNTKVIFKGNTFSILKIHNLTAIITTLILCSMFLRRLRIHS